MTHFVDVIERSSATAPIEQAARAAVDCHAMSSSFIWNALILISEIDSGDVDFRLGLKTGAEQQEFGVVRAALIFGPGAEENAPRWTSCHDDHATH